MESQEKYIKINDVTIFYTIYGSGPPVILLHGGLQTGTIAFRELIPLLVEDFTVYVPDARGHGKSNNPEGYLSYEQMANDYVAMIHQLGLKNSTIIGYSDGGQIILEMILKEPNIGRFITYGVYASTGPDYAKLWEKYKPALDKTADSQWYKDLLGEYFDEIQKEFSHVYGAEYYKEYFSQVVKMWADVNGYPGTKLKGRSAKLRLVHGDRDGIQVEKAVEIYRMIEGSELCVVPNANHYLPTTNPNRFYKYIKDYINADYE